MFITLPRSGLAATRTTYPLGQASHILWETSRGHVWEGIGSLSIKTFAAGQAVYEVDRARILVDDRSYLVLNAGQRYSVLAEAGGRGGRVESFCVFFENGLLEDVHRSRTESDEGLLDCPEAPRKVPLGFVERTTPHDATLSPALRFLKEELCLRAGDAHWLRERLYGLAGRLLEARETLRSEIDRFPGLRFATREELYRRLHRAREHAAASFAEPVSLEELASVACLSPSHFLRSFRRAFGETPHRFLTMRRLREARRLLLTTDLPVTEVCLSVGFASLGSFGALFHRYHGISPERFRRSSKGDFREAPTSVSSPSWQPVSGKE